MKVYEFNGESYVKLQDVYNFIESSDYYSEDLSNELQLAVLNELAGIDPEEYIMQMAHDAFVTGQPWDIDDYSEFARVCMEDGVRPSKELFDLFFSLFDEIRYSFNFENFDDDEYY